MKKTILFSAAALMFSQGVFPQETPADSVSKNAYSTKQPIPEAMDKVVALKQELDLADQNESIDKDKACHIIIVNQGSTAWSLENRLQGWVDVPLSAEGRKEISTLSKQLAHINFSGIYCSDLERSRETASIIAQGHTCPIVADFALRGESHGKLEGLTPQDYRKDPRYKQYKLLTPKEELFFSMGEGGESKADVARRMIPFLKRICEDNRGKTVVIVTHGGNIKFLNYLMSDCADESLISLPHGLSLSIYSDGRNFVRD